MARVRLRTARRRARRGGALEVRGPAEGGRHSPPALLDPAGDPEVVDLEAVSGGCAEGVDREDEAVPGRKRAPEETEAMPGRGRREARLGGPNGDEQVGGRDLLDAETHAESGDVRTQPGADPVEPSTRPRNDGSRCSKHEARRSPCRSHPEREAAEHPMSLPNGDDRPSADEAVARCGLPRSRDGNRPQQRSGGPRRQCAAVRLGRVSRRPRRGGDRTRCHRYPGRRRGGRRRPVRRRWRRRGRSGSAHARHPIGGAGRAAAVIRGRPGRTIRRGRGVDRRAVRG